MNERNRFDKFTERARKGLSYAQEEAQRFQHHYIGTEHLLLGLVREGEGIAAGVLQSLGVDLEKVRTQTIQVLGLPGESPKIEEPRTGPAPQLMIDLLKEAKNVVASIVQEKDLALQQKDYEQAAELGKREKKLRDSILKLETFWHLQAGFPQSHYTQSEIQIVEDEDLDIFTVQLLRVLSRSREEAQYLLYRY